MPYFIRHNSLTDADFGATTVLDGNYPTNRFLTDQHIERVVGPFFARDFIQQWLDGCPHWLVRDREEFRCTEENWKIMFVLSEPDRRNWRQREESRFNTGDYAEIPWTKLAGEFCPLTTVEQIARLDEESDRYAHLSVKHPGKIAYTESEQHGVDDRQIVTTPARYLRKFFPDITIHQRAIDAFVAAVALASAIPDLRLARTADEIERVYRNGPSSCMDGSHDFRVWPTRVYGDSDLAVAYLGNPETRVTARGVVWPGRKVYSRLYGNTHQLEMVLQSNGYTKGSIDGARIRRIEYPGRPGLIVMPYVDNVDGAEDIGGGWIRLGEGEIQTNETCGYVGEGCREVQCDHCGDFFDADDAYSVNGTVLCKGCYRRRRCCDACGDYYVPSVATHDNADHICESCAENGMAPCRDCGTWTEYLTDGQCDDCRPPEGEDTGTPTTTTDTRIRLEMISPDHTAVSGYHYTLVRLIDSAYPFLEDVRFRADATRVVRCSHGSTPVTTSDPEELHSVLARRDTLKRMYPHLTYAIVRHREPLTADRLPASAVSLFNPYGSEVSL